ncbi:MAG: Ku protein [Pseudolabrys sp.]|nr:Ku protein [Pseudolabrys sp.]
MAARAYWSGNIRLSLVSIPVDVFPATKAAAKIAFHQVHKPSGSRVRYQKVVPGVGEVENDDIVKGYELDKGKYVLLEPEEIDEIKLEAKKTLELSQFVGVHEIDPLYYDRPFFVLPQEDEDTEAYIVLRDALRKTKKVALGQIVIRGKGMLVALKACGDGLMLESLRYADEVKKADTAFKDVPDAKPDEDLIGLAEELIKRKSKKFNPGAFKDTYEEALRELIDAKAHHRKVKQIDEPQPGAKVINLMDALKKSVRQDNEPGGGKSSRRAAKSKSHKKKSSKRKPHKKAA